MYPDLNEIAFGKANIFAKEPQRTAGCVHVAGSISTNMNKEGTLPKSEKLLSTKN